MLGRFQHVLNLKEAGSRKWWHYAVAGLVAMAILPFSVQRGDSDKGPVNFSELEEKPVLVQSAPPVYPEEARRQGLEGKVFVRFLIGKDGKVKEVELLKGPETFRQASVDALRQFVFEPGKSQGRPVAVWMTQPLTFRLTEAEKDRIDLPQPSSSGSGGSVKKKPIEFWLVEKKPELIQEVPPVYPEIARKAGLEGRVFVKYLVDKGGRVRDVQVLRGPEVFRQAAIDAVKKLVFKPARQDGEPVAVWMTKPVTFRLNKRKEDFSVERIQKTRAVQVWVNAEGQILVNMEKQVALSELRAEIERRLQVDSKVGFLLKVDEGTPDEILEEVQEELRLHMTRFSEITLDLPKGYAGKLRDLFKEYDRKSEQIVPDRIGSQRFPEKFALLQNFPNPFNPETDIQYHLAEPASVQLRIYSVTGQVIRTLVAEHQAAGRYQVRWDGKDDRGRTVASGVYTYRLQAGEFQDIKRMQLLK